MKTFLTIVIVLMSTITFSQEKTIKGKVIDELGEPLTGVSVVEKGTTNGTTSNFDGDFTIKITSVFLFRL